MVTKREGNCAECGGTMYRKWTGARYGNRVICLQCNLNGYRFDSQGKVYQTGATALKERLEELAKVYETKADMALADLPTHEEPWVFYWSVTERLKGLLHISPFIRGRELRNYYSGLIKSREALTVAMDHDAGKRLETLLRELEHLLTY